MALSLPGFIMFRLHEDNFRKNYHLSFFTSSSKVSGWMALAKR